MHTHTPTNLCLQTFYWFFEMCLVFIQYFIPTPYLLLITKIHTTPDQRSKEKDCKTVIMIHCKSSSMR